MKISGFSETLAAVFWTARAAAFSPPVPRVRFTYSMSTPLISARRRSTTLTLGAYSIRPSAPSRPPLSVTLAMRLREGLEVVELDPLHGDVGDHGGMGVGEEVGAAVDDEPAALEDLRFGPDP